jgi:COP9 signalosome complex subunit 5
MTNWFICFSSKIAAEAQHGLISQVLKDVIFSRRLAAAEGSAAAPVTDVIDAAMSG